MEAVFLPTVISIGPCIATMTRTRQRSELYGCLGCGHVLHDFKWHFVKIHMRVCCPERMNDMKLRARCKIGGLFCEVPGFESRHNWQNDSYSQHVVSHSYRNWDQPGSYEYSGSWGRREEHVPSPQGNYAYSATSQQGNDTDYAYYGPSLAGEQLRMSLLQASRQRFDDIVDSSNDSLQEEAPRMVDLQTSKQCVDDDGSKDTDYAYYGPTLAGDQLRTLLLQASRQRLNESMDSGNDSMEEGALPEIDLKAGEHREEDGTDTGLAQTQEAVGRSPQAHPRAGVAIKIEDTPTKYPPAAASSSFQAWDLHVSPVRVKMEDTHPQKAALSSTTDESADLATQDTDDAAVKDVRQWLEKKVSHWSTMWKNKYATSLVDYGFDSAAILDRDLRVDNAEKILTEGVGMKRGHALSLRHALEDGP